MLTRKEVVKKVMGAFLPFRSAVQISDDGAKVKVFDPHRVGMVKISCVPLRRMQDERHLAPLLVEMRRRLQREGYVFNPLSTSSGF